MDDTETQEGSVSAFPSRSRLDSAAGGEGSCDDNDDNDAVSFAEGKTSENPAETGASTRLDKYMIKRREKRLAMNRESARNRRQRKKMMIQSLDDQVAKLRESNQLLQTTNDSLTARIRVLENDLAVARATISQFSGTGALASVPTHENRVTTISFQPQHLSNQSQFLQHHPTQTGPSQSQVFYPAYPSTLSAPINNPSSILVGPLSMEANTASNSSAPNQFDPLRSFVRTGEIAAGIDSQFSFNKACIQAASAGSTQNSAIPEGNDNLSRLIQAHMNHFGMQGIPTAINVQGPTEAAVNSSWNNPGVTFGTVPPIAFPSMEDSLHGVSTNWEITERHEVPSTSGGMIQHSNLNTVSINGIESSSQGVLRTC
jgi:hypothetical protein